MHSTSLHRLYMSGIQPISSCIPPVCTDCTCLESSPFHHAFHQSAQTVHVWNPAHFIMHSTSLHRLYMSRIQPISSCIPPVCTDCTCLESSPFHHAFHQSAQTVHVWNPTQFIMHCTSLHSTTWQSGWIVQHGGQAESLWTHNYRRWGLKLSVKPPTGLWEWFGLVAPLRWAAMRAILMFE